MMHAFRIQCTGSAMEKHEHIHYSMYSKHATEWLLISDHSESYFLISIKNLTQRIIIDVDLSLHSVNHNGIPCSRQNYHKLQPKGVLPCTAGTRIQCLPLLALLVQTHPSCYDNQKQNNIMMKIIT